MKTYTVTGATGYIGSKVIEYLTNKGHFVYAITRKNSKISEVMKHENVEIHQYNGFEIDLEDPIKKSDYIIHLGALYTTSDDDDSTIDLINSNILFSTQIFNVANKVNKEIVISTASTFSSLNGQGEHAPSTLYAATKSAIETIAKYYSGLSIHFLAFPDTYGPGDWRPKIHNILARNEKWPFEFKSSSKQEMKMLHIEDVIGHILHSLKQEDKGVHFHDIYSEGVLVTLKELSEKITDKECLFNENAELTYIPKEPREISKSTGYINKYKEIKFTN